MLKQVNCKLQTKVSKEAKTTTTKDKHGGQQKSK
jgi:hypothetical protein